MWAADDALDPLTTESRSVEPKAKAAHDVEPTGPTEMPAWVPRAIRISIFWVLATVIGVLLLVQLEDLIRYLVLALFLAFALEPGVQWLHRKHGWKRGTATGAILTGAVFLGIG